MFRGETGRLTKAEEQMLDEQAARIAAMGSQWQPSKENLMEVLLAVKAAGEEEHRLRQAEGIASARDRGVTLGRPRKERPKNFPYLVSAIDSGDLSRMTVAKTLGVSRETLRRWLNAYKSEIAQQAQQAQLTQ